MLLFRDHLPDESYEQEFGMRALRRFLQRSSTFVDRRNKKDIGELNFLDIFYEATTMIL